MKISVWIKGTEGEFVINRANDEHLEGLHAAMSDPTTVIKIREDNVVRFIFKGSDIIAVAVH
jgi:hypothetical protein